MNFPICWKLWLHLLNTKKYLNIIISLILIILTDIVKILINKFLIKNYHSNQQVTNNNNNLVGTSETTREILNKNISSNKFNQWLAGLIDADGYFGIVQGKYTSCEITLGLEDEKTLYQIKNKFGGSIKLRSGVKAVRYRLHNKSGMVKLINAVNGNIRNSKRLLQFFKVCNILQIKLLNLIKLNSNNSWFIGFFDGDGTITYSFKNKNLQLTISVSNKYLQDVEEFKNIFGGNIYFDKSNQGSFKWCLQSKKDVINWINSYVKLNLSRTTKFNRLMLVKIFFDLKLLKAYHNLINTAIYKAWLKFEFKWNSKNI